MGGSLTEGRLGELHISVVPFPGDGLVESHQDPEGVELPEVGYGQANDAPPPAIQNPVGDRVVSGYALRGRGRGGLELG